jgi:hypothetical protein
VESIKTDFFAMQNNFSVFLILRREQCNILPFFGARDTSTTSAVTPDIGEWTSLFLFGKNFYEFIIYLALITPQLYFVSAARLKNLSVQARMKSNTCILSSHEWLRSGGGSQSEIS